MSAAMTKNQRAVRKDAIKRGFQDYGDGSFLKIRAEINERGRVESVVTRMNADGTIRYVKRIQRLCALPGCE